ncbi:MAG TPA: hypothetical protein DEB17_05740 [Chlorobaculum sp.]|uniref:Uncharacterized protein n=1 Tax=Chlorobaculum tepidum (strain ATCC 49652 / DSM 12025 / NBRC 103806 / TLS) TaxID=194439 RepID=Q8KF22_CHLTE|nr:hypothetical protein CT0510 [Chlorobaculum tepidum TLS]HBU23487.1 hypothetical protein [Chlorobaculum sp.]
MKRLSRIILIQSRITLIQISKTLMTSYLVFEKPLKYAISSAMVHSLHQIKIKTEHQFHFS